ncbi:hypothetical protein, conserved [Angomonas deanei]|uniref:DUF7623 domain-containing protein n=1 Tax=Angomonas deanei TaxID=59799 RepID=A0A7G2C733_9TRYP|nr:hypothetical protein, conserved [Angomonas deanei]
MRELEKAMNDRAHAMAEDMRDKAREGVLPDSLKGLPKSALHVDEDMPFNDLEVAYLKAEGDGDEEKKDDLAAAMVKRAGDIADKLRGEERANLGSPLGYDPKDLPLDENDEYVKKEGELIGLRVDPKKNAGKIQAAEDELKDIAMELAKEKADNERTYLDSDLEGNNARNVDLLADPAYAGLEEEYHRKVADPYADQDHLADLERMMNDRAHELARKKNAEDRPNYVEEHRNVPLHELPLDTDETVRELEAERARLKQDPVKNKDALRAVEEKVNDRVAELTEEALKGDRIFLDDVPEGVLQRQVNLDDDPTFRDLEQKRAALKSQDPKKNAAAIKDLEDQMNDRLHELANQEKWDARNDMEPEPLGIPLKDLGAAMDADPEFNKLEEMYRDARKDPKRAKEADNLLAQMNDRARELAEEMHEKERANLDQEADGIPLDALPLNEDEKFLALENEARRLQNEPNGARKNAERLAELDDQMNERAKELANELRKEYIDPEPEGIPLELLKLGDDPDFVDKENELRRLEKNPHANAARIADLKKDLNDMAHEKARDMLQNDRDYLDPNPEGVDLRHLPLDTDPQFHEMEAERARLKAEDPRKNQRAIADLEGKLNDRAHELAKGGKG